MNITRFFPHILADELSKNRYTPLGYSYLFWQARLARKDEHHWGLLTHSGRRAWYEQMNITGVFPHILHILADELSKNR
jgi:hypothetical protein